jgi:uncharacterized membrane protein YtjA (UPF0391 family)
MSTWLILLIAALIAGVIGFAIAAKWLLIFALAFLVLGVLGYGRGRKTGI